MACATGAPPAPACMCISRAAWALAHLLTLACTLCALQHEGGWTRTDDPHGVMTSGVLQ